MRKLLVLFLVGVLLCPAIAFGDDKPVTYELTIKITYNALENDDVVAILKDAIREHEKACKFDFRVVKGSNRAENLTSDNIIFWDHGDGTIRGIDG